MRAVRTPTNKPVNSGFLSLLERYWLVLLGLILVIPYLLRYLKDASTKNSLNDIEEEIKLNHAQNLDPTTQLLGMNKITTNPAYHNWAKNLAHNLGTIYSSKGNWWDIFNPRGWTENDLAVYNDLKNVTNNGQKRILTELYFFLTSRDLTYDLKSYLDSEYLKKLPFFK